MGVLTDQSSRQNYSYSLLQLSLSSWGLFLCFWKTDDNSRKSAVVSLLVLSVHYARKFALLLVPQYLSLIDVVTAFKGNAIMIFPALIVCFLAFAKAAEKSEIAVLVNDDVSFTCESDSVAVWSKEESKGATMLAAGSSILPNWDSSRYAFTQKGRNYVMTISDVTSDDAGVFVCNNKFEFSLVVIGVPQCGPEVASVIEDRHFDFTCASSLYGSSADSKATSSWTLGEDILQSEDEKEKNEIRSSISYTAKYLDHEKELKCEINHPNWDGKKPKPSCSFAKLNVQFKPKINCPSNLLFKPEDKEYLIKCHIIGNPLPSVSAIKWEFQQKDERLKMPSFQTKTDSIDATLKLTNHHLSVRKSNRIVTLKVPNALNPSEKSFVTKQISVGLIHGPVVSCPETIKVKSKDKGIAKIECRIHVNPIPPNSNISWYVDDDFIQRQRQDMIEKVTYIFGRTDPRRSYVLTTVLVIIIL